MARKTQKKQKKDQDGSTLEVKRRRRNLARDSPFQRSSSFRGVTRHRLSGRYEAHLWDKNCWNKTQNRKGRQVYLGAYEEEAAAARAYDLAALKYWGKDTLLNFAASEYHKELQEMECQSREEYIGSLRRKSSGFSRGVSKYRGVARHHHNGRWEARIGKVFGNKYLYLGTYATQEEAATAYDKAAVQYRGVHAVTNFDLSRYLNPSSEIQVHPSLNSSLESGNDDVSKSEEDLTETLRDPLRCTGNSKPDYHDDVDSTCDRTKACRSSPTSTCIRRLSPQSCSDLKVDLSFISGDDSLTKEIDTITIELQERVENSWKTVESPASYDQLDLIDRSFCERKWIYSERQDSKDYLDVLDPVFDDLDSFESPIFKNAFECVK